MFTKHKSYNITCVAKTSSSPTEKRAMKPYRGFRQKAVKQNTAPRNVETDRSCSRQREQFT